MATKAGKYSIGYRVAPGLTGKATAARGRTSGSFEVTIDDEPVPARVGEDGEVERGVDAGGASRTRYGGDVDGLGPFGPGLGLEGHLRALAQRPEAVGC